MSPELILTGFSVLLGLISFVVFVVVLVKMVRYGGCLLGILGFFIPLVTFIWGWVKAKELEMADIMLFWTVVIVLSTIVSIVAGITQNPELREMMNSIGAGGF